MLTTAFRSRLVLLVVLVLGFVWWGAAAGPRETRLGQILKNADSVWLASHETTEGIVIRNDKTGKETPPPRLMVGGRPNEKIIVKKIKADSATLETLVSLLTRPSEDHMITRGMCFIPHHAIFIFKGKKVSYMDICFSCHNFSSSGDLQLLQGFNEKKWTALTDFFWRIGLAYTPEW